MLYGLHTFEQDITPTLIKYGSDLTMTSLRCRVASINGCQPTANQLEVELNHERTEDLLSDRLRHLYDLLFCSLGLFYHWRE